MARLDAALAAISAGEVSPIAAGISFCSMLTACDRTGDVRRAQEWTGIVAEHDPKRGQSSACAAHALPNRLWVGAVRGGALAGSGGADGRRARAGGVAHDRAIVR